MSLERNIFVWIYYVCIKSYKARPFWLRSQLFPCNNYFKNLKRKQIEQSQIFNFFFRWGEKTGYDYHGIWSALWKIQYANLKDTTGLLWWQKHGILRMKIAVEGPPLRSNSSPFNKCNVSLVIVQYQSLFLIFVKRKKEKEEKVTARQTRQKR